MDEHRDGIQADKPIPPWERPGCFRMDCEPHRGTLLNWLALPSVFLCHFSLLIQGVYFWSALHGRVRLWDAFTDHQYLFICRFDLFLTAMAMPLALTSWFLARRDLAMIQQGLMNPGGEKQTQKARLIGKVGLVVSGLLAAYSGIVLLMMS